MFLDGSLGKKGYICFWRKTGASDFILDVIENGYKILFKVSPLPYCIENRNYTHTHRNVVDEAVNDLLERGCIRKFVSPPRFCNSLHVAVQSSGKLRLVSLTFLI